jgi:glycosyltransferase involved in cell wall biosynthesis
MSAGHEVMVFLGGRGPVTEQLDAAGVPFHSLNHLIRDIRPDADIRAYFELSHELHKWRPDLVSTHTAKAGWLGRAAAARLRLPVIYTPHGWPIGDRISRAHGLVFTCAERVAARWASAIVCVCEYERKLALEHGIAPPERLRVVHNGVRDSAFRALPEVHPPRLVSVARFEAPKDHATLLHALAQLRDTEWRLDLVGEGPLEQEISRMARALGIGDRLRFLGYRSDPAETLAAGQIFVLSSRSEGFPRSILEAMRAGLPVVASDVGGVSEAVAHGVTGLVVPRQDVTALAAALTDLMRNSGTRQLFGAAARQIYDAHFTLNAMVQKTLAVYDNVVSGTAKSTKVR